MLRYVLFPVTVAWLTLTVLSAATLPKTLTVPETEYHQNVRTITIPPLRRAITSPIPHGFLATDAYSDPYEACIEESRKAATRHSLTASQSEAVYAYCFHRLYHSSRGNRIVSNVDGSGIHDRDRPTSHRFYSSLLASGHLDPSSCRYHRIDPSIPHPPEGRKLRREWPFSHTRLPDSIARQWFAHPHDMEKFGARGYFDHNANAYKYLPGCWDPAQLERADVGAYVTAEKAARICEAQGKCTKQSIRKVWGKDPRNWKG